MCAYFFFLYNNSWIDFCFHFYQVCGKSFTRNRDMIGHKKKIHLSHNNNERNGSESEALSLNAHYRTHAAPTAFHPTALMHHLNHQATIIHPSFL